MENCGTKNVNTWDVETSKGKDSSKKKVDFWGLGFWGPGTVEGAICFACESNLT